MGRIGAVGGDMLKSVYDTNEDGVIDYDKNSTDRIKNVIASEEEKAKTVADWANFGNATYSKAHEFTLNLGTDITLTDLRVKVNLARRGVGLTSYAKIYKNGEEIPGTEVSDGSSDGAVYPQDLSGFVDGDTIELWIKGTDSNGGTWRHFGIYGSLHSNDFTPDETFTAT